MITRKDFKLPKVAKFERSVKRPPAEVDLVEAIRDKKRQDPEADTKIQDILKKATEEIRAL